MNIPLAIGKYLTNGERAVNCYSVPRTDPSIGDYISFRGTEGLELFCTLSGQALRGLYVASQDETKMYAVAGNKFYQVLADGTFAQKGLLLTAQGLVEFSDNGDDGTAKTGIFISDGTYGYTYQPTTGAFAQVTDPNFPGAASNTFLDGFTIVVDPGTEKAYSSGLYDFSAWNALDFTSAESDPDDLLKIVKTPHGMLAMLGVVSTEFWYNAGLAAFPFARMQGARFGYGLAALNSIALNDQSMFFLARTTTPQGDRVIVQVQGYQPTIVSPEDLNEELAKLTATADAEGFAYMREGHAFYELTFPTDARTFVIDAMTGMWHERTSMVNGVETRHRARCYAYFNGFHMAGDFSTGNIYKLKENVYTENGTMIRRKICPPELIDRSGNAKISISELFVPMKTGVGLDGEGQGMNPLVMFRYSKDGGKTWSNEKQASLGKLGEYRKRVRFLRLGWAYRWRFELAVSDPVEVEFTGPLVATE